MSSVTLTSSNVTELTRWSCALSALRSDIAGESACMETVPADTMQRLFDLTGGFDMSIWSEGKNWGPRGNHQFKAVQVTHELLLVVGNSESLEAWLHYRGMWCITVSPAQWHQPEVVLQLRTSATSYYDCKRD